MRTVFNLLGPLTNPAGARAQVVGVPSAELIDLVAATLAELGVEAARLWFTERADWMKSRLLEKLSSPK